MLDILKAATIAFKNDRSAAGALEYALLCSFIAIAVIAGATLFGTSLKTYFSSMSTAVGGWNT